MFKNTAFSGQKQPKIYQAWWILGLLSAILLNLSACGFHLKGTGANAVATFKSVQLLDENLVRPDVLRALKQQLKASNVKLVTLMADAEITIQFQITGYRTSRTGLSSSGDTSSELLKMSQAFEVVDVATEKALLKTSAQTFRDRQIDNSAVLASSRELRSIQQQMANDLAVQIIDRINRAKRP